MFSTRSFQTVAQPPRHHMRSAGAIALCKRSCFGNGFTAESFIPHDEAVHSINSRATMHPANNSGLQM